MRFHRPEILAALRAMAGEHEILFIADEIATGFWRTGHRFACGAAGIRPDLLCVGKALTGGTMTMGATLAREEIFAAFLSDDWDAALMHGPTYMANPLACTAANASLDLFEREPREAQVHAIEAGLRVGLEPCRGLPGVLDVRVRGAIGVVQLEPGMDIYALRPRFVEQGVWVHGRSRTWSTCDAPPGDQPPGTGHAHAGRSRGPGRSELNRDEFRRVGTAHRPVLRGSQVGGAHPTKFRICTCFFASHRS